MNLDLERLTETYVQCCTTEGKSPQTIKSYQTDIKRFVTFLKANQQSLAVDDVGLPQVRNYIYYLQKNVRRWENNPYVHQDKNLSAISIQDYARSLKCFWSWLLREGYIEKNPLVSLRLPKASRKIIATFNPEQIDIILKSINAENINGIRDYTIVLVFIDTGIRLSELINLEIDNIDFAQSCFTVRGKGDKERVIPFGSQVRKALVRYINKYRSEPATSQVNQLFLSREGLPLKKRNIQEMVSRTCQKAGITGIRSSPHTFRHTFARQYLMNGGDIFSLQRILGHSSLEIVKIYINLASADIILQHRKFSPLDNMLTSNKYKLFRTGIVNNSNHFQMRKY